jgi:ribosome-interacting GTPase 1
VPANLTPEYKNAQDAFRRARDPKERLECLRDMLRTIPKHKGTEHLQADIKTRIKELTDELTGPKKGGARGGPALVIRSEGAAQIALVGPPNVGKSSLHVRLTGSHAAVAPYPYTTKLPLPGMLRHEDIHFQLVDLPPISAAVVEPWIGNTLQTAEGVLLVLDLNDPECVEHVTAIRQRLDAKRVKLLEGIALAAGTPDRAGFDEVDDPFRVHLPTVLVANKADLLADPAEELEAFRQLSDMCYPAAPVSAESGQGLDRIGPLLFETLGIVRVYTKSPGQPPVTDRPFTVRRNGTVRDVARLVHRGLATEVKFARLWGSADFDGQQVSCDHPVLDGDVVELHR